MRKISLFKALFTLVAFFIVTNSNAQTVHPLSFPAYALGTTTTGPNYYANYVGTQFDLTYPASIAGSYNHTEATTADGWTAITTVTTPILNVPIVVANDGSTADTLGCGTLINGTGSVPSMTGKVALVFRGNCLFTDKAYDCQMAGAIAVIIVDNVPGAPFAPGAGGTHIAAVTIPVFMISQADGAAWYNQILMGVAPTITITPWGQGLRSDLGFVPAGAALWHDFAIPFNQLTASSVDSLPYIGKNGAFIANYGTSNQTNVMLKSVLTFTGASGTTTIHTDSVTLPTFNAIDSIWAMYTPPYNLSALTDTGHYTMTYTISSDSIDMFPGNNTYSYNFYATTNLYCKGTYDFANQHPMANLYEQSGSDYYIWGNAYYIGNGGANLNSVQFSVEGGTAGPIAVGNIPVYVFKWVDGRVDSTYSVAYPYDSLMENGELELMGVALKTFSGAGADTSGGWWTVDIGDSLGNPLTLLATQGWYYVAPEVPGAGTSGYYLGCDGNLNAFPRVYGRNHFNNYYEYSSPVYGGARSQGANPQYNNMDVALGAIPFMEASFITSIDSTVFHDQIGLIPGVSLISTPFTTGVKNVSTPSFEVFTLSPNPATDRVDVNIVLPETSKEVTYTIIDNAARFISKEVHYNVLSEKYSFNTSNLASGNYFMIVTANGKEMFKKFTVIK